LDELPPQTRKLLKEIQHTVKAACQQQGMAQSDFRFSRKHIRNATQWGNTQLKVHLKRLEDMEYLLIHRGGRGQSFEYELLYDNTQGNPSHLMGLIDVQQLKKHKTQHYDKKKSGVSVERSGPSRPQVGGGSDPLKTLQPLNNKGCHESGSLYVESTLQVV
jgi:hypothetical protein